MLEPVDLDLFGLAREADCLAARISDARCCDAFKPCRSCRFLRQCVLARRLVIRVPRVVPARQAASAPVLQLAS